MGPAPGGGGSGGVPSPGEFYAPLSQPIFPARIIPVGARALNFGTQFYAALPVNNLAFVDSEAALPNAGPGTIVTFSGKAISVGRLVVLAVVAPINGGADWSVADNAPSTANVWTMLVKSNNASGRQVQLFYSVLATAIGTLDIITATLPSSVDCTGYAMWFSGNHATPADGSNTATGNSTGWSSGTLVNANAVDVAIGAFAAPGSESLGDFSYSASDGYTRFKADTGASATKTSVRMMYKIISSSATQEAVETVNTSLQYAGLIGCFKSS